jgi:hypothetical protein
MPSFNRRGDLCIGLGRFWYDDDRTIAQECGTALALANTTTPRNPCIIALSDGTVVHTTGTIQLRANGAGMWACIPYPGPLQGYLDALGRTLTDRGPDTISPDGAVLLRPHSNAFAEVLEADGTRWMLADYDIFDAQLLGQRRAIWRDKRQGWASPIVALGDLVFEQPSGEFGGAKLVHGPEGFVLLYQSFAHGLVLGNRVVARGVNFYAPDAFFDGARWHIAWSTQPQEVGVTPAPLVFTVAEWQSMPPVGGTAPPVITPPPPIVVPTPEPEHMPVAPNQIENVRAAITFLRNVDSRAEGPFAPNRGGITQFVAAALGAPWGRKSRDRSATNLSDDALCYRLPDGRFEIYDILNGTDGTAAWDYKGAFADGENGYFLAVSAAPPPPVVVPDPPKPSIDLAGIFARLDAMDKSQQESAARTSEALLIVAEALDALRVKKQAVTFPAYAGFLKFNGAVKLEPVK